MLQASLARRLPIRLLGEQLNHAPARSVTSKVALTNLPGNWEESHVRSLVDQYAGVTDLSLPNKGVGPRLTAHVKFTDHRSAISVHAELVCWGG